MLDVEKENDKLKEEIEKMKKTINEKEERIVKLELENTTLENQARITESSLEEMRQKIDSVTEAIAIEKSDHEELKDRFQIDTERLKQQLTEALEEVKAKENRIESLLRETREKNSPDGSVSEENEPESKMCINSLRPGRVNEDDFSRFINNPDIQPKSLILVNRLLNDINSRLSQLSARNQIHS